MDFFVPLDTKFVAIKSILYSGTLFKELDIGNEDNLPYWAP